MYAYGGDSCVNEFYHSWFNNGTVWDNVFTSLYGPPPGYVPGGPNKDFSIPSMTPPGGQPPQKSYKEWNTGWNGTANENSWEITEAGIYTQAAYISLLVRVMATGMTTPLPLHSITLNAERNGAAVLVAWEVNNADDARVFEVERSTDGIHFSSLCQVNASLNTTRYNFTDNSTGPGAVYYRIKETGLQDEVHYSSIVKLKATDDQGILSVYPNPVRDQFVVSGYASSAGLLELRIFDQSGKLIKFEKWMQSRGHYSRTISADVLSQGIYYLKVSSKEKSVQVKIIRF
jgi:endoglucanase